jgi:hypothetical protein
MVCAFTLLVAGWRLMEIFLRGREPSGRSYPVTGVANPVGVHRSKGAIASVNIAVRAGVDVTFTLYRESWIDGLAKALGIARELQTGDVAFDKRIFIQSEDPDVHDALRTNRELRKRLLDLMSSKAREISAANGHLWVISHAYNHLKERDDAEVARTVTMGLMPGINSLLPELAKIRGAPDADSRDQTRLVRRGISAAIATCYVCAVLGSIYALMHVDHQIVREAITRAAWAVTAGFVTALATVLALLVGATAFTHRVVLDIAIAAAPAAWLVGFGGAIWANQQFDSSVSRRVSIPVERVYATGKRNDDWHLEVTGWPDPRGDRLVEISQSEAASVSGRCIDVLWRDGSLGDGWIERYQRPETCDESVEK